MSEIEVRKAAPEAVELVAGVLQQVSCWLEARGMPMWKQDELHRSVIERDILNGLFFIAWFAGEPAGVIKYQWTDRLFWPDMPEGDAAYVHRVAVTRPYAGCGVSTAMLQWAADRAVSEGRRYLRLDCEASRQPLRSVYERFGFSHHSDRTVGPYHVARYELRLPLGSRP